MSLASIRGFFGRNSIKSFVQACLVVALPVFLFLFILSWQQQALRGISRDVRYNTVYIVPLLMILLYLTYRIPGWWGHLVSFSLVLGLYALTLVGLWSSGLDNYYAVSGLIPWADARDYFIDAQRLLESGLLSDFSAWHPLFPAFVAPLLGIAGNNLQITVSILALLVGAASHIAGREVQQTHGSAPGALVTATLFVYYRQFSGTLVSENLGLMLGALGFAALWRSASSKRLGMALAGIFLITAALTSRLGTFFILPLLTVWCGLYFRERLHFSWKAAGLAIAAVIAGFSIYFLVVLNLSPRQSLLFPNYASPFYDFATGYRFWGSLREDHPDIYKMQDPELSIRTYQAAFEEIYKDPKRIISGALKEYATFFFRDWYSAYSFFETSNTIIQIFIHAFFYLLSLTGLWKCFKEKQDAVHGLVLALSIGLFVSIPFVPPGLFNRMRTYAATMIILAALPAMGLSFIMSKLKWRFFEEKMVTGMPLWLAVTGGLGLLVFLVIGQVVIHLQSRQTSFTEVQCEAGQVAVYIRINPGSQVNVTRDDDADMNWLPDFRNGRFKRYLHDYSPHYLAMEEFEKLKPPATVLVALDLKTNQDLCLIAPRDLIPSPPAVLGICGHWSDNPKVQPDRFFYAESAIISK